MSLLLSLTFALLPSITFAAPTANNQKRDLNTCISRTQGSICEPLPDNPKMAIGDHINLDFVATSIRHPVNSTGIDAKLLSRKTGKLTQLTWFQRDENGISNSNLYPIVTSHNIFGAEPLGSAFGGEGQFPCSLFDENPGGEERFTWILTHYWGDHCSYNNTKACYPIPGLIDVLPFSEPRSILLKDNAEVCGRKSS